MPKRYSSDELSAFALSLGFKFVSQKGSHIKFKDKEGRIAIIPKKNKEIPIGTTTSIMAQLGSAIKQLLNHYTK